MKLRSDTGNQTSSGRSDNPAEKPNRSGGWRQFASWQRLAAELWKGERDRDFLSEALVFAAIIALSAWPVLLMVKMMATAFP